MARLFANQIFFDKKAKQKKGFMPFLLFRIYKNHMVELPGNPFRILGTTTGLLTYILDDYVWGKLAKPPTFPDLLKSGLALPITIITCNKGFYPFTILPFFNLTFTFASSFFIIVFFPISNTPRYKPSRTCCVSTIMFIEPSFKIICGPNVNFIILFAF
jgi:hypothetical protein